MLSTVTTAAAVVVGQASPPPVDSLAGLLAVLDSRPVRFAAALLVVGVGAALSKYVVRLLGRPIARQFERESIAQVVLRLLRAGVVAASVGFGASLLGFGVGDVLLSVTVFSAILGIILAPIVGNLINGIFVLADQPYEIGDMIELSDGTRGFVEDITVSFTKILTLDNTFLVIPNSTIRSQQVTNYSAEDQRVRLRLSVDVTYEGDLEAARTLLERAARDCEGVVDGGPDIRIGAARYPAKPTAYVDGFADSGITVTLRYWAEQPYKLLTVRSAVQSRFWTLMIEEQPDVEVAYPHQQLLVDEESPLRVQTESAGPPGAPRNGDPAADADAESDDTGPA